MPTAISVANFETALGQCYDALTSKDFASASLWYARAEAQACGLVVSASDSAASLTRRQALDALKKAIDYAQTIQNRADSGSRFITARTGFHGD